MLVLRRRSKQKFKFFENECLKLQNDLSTFVAIETKLTIANIDAPKIGLSNPLIF
jgi:hypothetical protein